MGIELGKNKGQEIDPQKEFILVAKEKRAEVMQLFFGEPNPFLRVEKIYESNEKWYCRTTDFTLEFPKGKEGQIHAVSFLIENFQILPSPQPSKK
jgi:hypothetical protein